MKNNRGREAFIVGKALTKRRLEDDEKPKVVLEDLGNVHLEEKKEQKKLQKTQETILEDQKKIVD